ncbi:MAG: glycoside hydrolase family 3 protein [Treponemataceae bacterium]|nr:glycoside hydrolase family 3 protein [Treponemataceae bacterium]
MRFSASVIITLCMGALSACSPTPSGLGEGRAFPVEVPSQEKAVCVQGQQVPVLERETIQESAEKKERLQRLKALVVSLSDEVLAAQVLLSGVDGKGRLSQAMELLLREIPVGGVMLFRYNISPTGSELCQYTTALKNLLQRRYEISSEKENEGEGTSVIMPFIAIDHEGGSVDRLYPLTSFFPSPQWYALGHGLFPGKAPPSADAVQQTLTTIASAAYQAGGELAALGFNLNLAPLAEPLTVENGPFVGDRSFGSDPAFVASAAAAFVQGMERAGVATVAKHFPHSSAVDPHQDVAILAEPLSNLIPWLLPFQRLAAMEGGPAAIMVSHSIVVSLDRYHPASLSSFIIQHWLKGELAYEGIALADDFSMGAIAKTGKIPERAVVEALAAGIDMVLVWPRDLRRVHQTILSAVKKGELPRSRLEDAVQRILMQKARYGLVDWEAVRSL